MKTQTIYIIVAVIILISLVIIFKDKLFKEEQFRDIQYAMLYPDAIDEQNFAPTIEGCIEFCQKLNTGDYDQIQCMDSCMLYSGYIPRLEMLTDKQQLVDYL